MSHRDRSRSPPRGGGGRSGLNFDELHSVRIGNDLPDNITKDDLRDKFGKYGEIGDIFIPVDGSSQRSRGFAFVRFHGPGVRNTSFCGICFIRKIRKMSISSNN